MKKYIIITLGIIMCLALVSAGIFSSIAIRSKDTIEIDSVQKNKIFLSEIDILDGSPIFDIKPYITQFDQIASEKDGWYERGLNPMKILSDGRFK